MPITTALPRTEGGLTSDNVICPCVNRQKAHWSLGVARSKSWDCRCAELTASAEEKSNRRANKSASADFATNTQVFRSSRNLFAKEPDHSNRRKFYFFGANPPTRRRALRVRNGRGDPCAAKSERHHVLGAQFRSVERVGQCRLRQRHPGRLRYLGESFSH